MNTAVHHIHILQESTWKTANWCSSLFFKHCISQR